MTTKLRLERLSHTDFATYGQIVDDENQVLCLTLEKPWLENAHNVSCIPPGTYAAFRRSSPKRGYDVFELAHVPGRSNIELHIGNLPRDSEGCILLGSNFGTVDGQRGITGSTVAFARFMTRLKHVQGFELEVVAPAPSPS
jgi:hypothetical protein